MENYLWRSSGNELWPWQWGQHAQLHHRPALSCCSPRALPRRLWAWLHVTLLMGTWPGGDTRAKRGKSSKNLAYKHSCPLGDVNHSLHHNISIIPFSALFFSLHSSNFNILLLLPHEKSRKKNSSSSCCSFHPAMGKLMAQKCLPPTRFWLWSSVGFYVAEYDTGSSRILCRAIFQKMMRSRAQSGFISSLDIFTCTCSPYAAQRLTETGPNNIVLLWFLFLATYNVAPQTYRKSEEEPCLKLNRVHPLEGMAKGGSWGQAGERRGRRLLSMFTSRISSQEKLPNFPNSLIGTTEQNSSFGRDLLRSSRPTAWPL